MPNPRRPLNRRRLLPILWAKSGGICTVCDVALTPPIHIDHIIPIAVGGTNDVANLQLLHKLCNNRKKDSPMAEAVARIRTTPVGHHQLRPGQKLVSFYMSPDLLSDLDDFRFGYRLSSRGTAIRFLLRAALDSDPIPEPREKDEAIEERAPKRKPLPRKR
jgi:hypothetical protein